MTARPGYNQIATVHVPLIAHQINIAITVIATVHGYVHVHVGNQLTLAQQNVKLI